MKRIIPVFVALLLIASFSQAEKEDLIKQAGLFLDMMEYRAAIDIYLKALAEDPQQRDVRKNIAYAYFELKKTEEALKFIKEEQELFPDNTDAYNLLSYILFKQERLQEARSVLESFGIRQGFTLENLHLGDLSCFILGMCFKENKEYDKAGRWFRMALEKGFDSIQCSIQWADSELARGKPVSAKEILLKAVEKNRSRADIYAMFGLLYFEMSKSNSDLLSASITGFERAVELDANFKEALFNLACIYHNDYRDYRKASKYFERVLSLEPENVKVKFYLDCCLKKADEPSIKISPDCPKEINFCKDFIEKPGINYYKLKNDINIVLENINYLGLEFIRSGKFLEAARRFRNGLILDPESPGMNFNLGMVYFWQDNLKEAEKHALTALRRRNFFGRLSLAKKREILKDRPGFFQKSPDTSLSEWTFEAALREGSYFLDAYDLLGSIYFKKEEFASSLLAYKKVVEVDEEDAMGHYNLGCAYMALKDLENAEKEWKETIKHEKEAPRRSERKISADQLEISLVVHEKPVFLEAHKSLGKLYFEKNLPDEALSEFKKAAELEPDDPEPCYELGRIYQARKDTDRAIFYYEKYIYLGGEREAEVKELLKLLKK